MFTVKSSSVSVSSCLAADVATDAVTSGSSATALTVTSKLSVTGWLSCAPVSLDVTLVVIVVVPE